MVYLGKIGHFDLLLYKNPPSCQALFVWDSINFLINFTIAKFGYFTISIKNDKNEIKVGS